MQATMRKIPYRQAFRKKSRTQTNTPLLPGTMDNHLTYQSIIFFDSFMFFSFSFVKRKHGRENTDGNREADLRSDGLGDGEMKEGLF